MKDSHIYTKEEIKKVIELWNNSSMANIAERLNLKKNHINYLAIQIRKAGYSLPRKSFTGRTQNLIKEVIEELR